MPRDIFSSSSRARSSSASTVRAQLEAEAQLAQNPQPDGKIRKSFQANLSVHSDAVSRDSVLFAESLLSDSGFEDGDLVELQQLVEGTAVRDFQKKADNAKEGSVTHPAAQQDNSTHTQPTYLCIVKTASPEEVSKLHGFEVSINKQIATTFGFTSPSQIAVNLASEDKWTSSHVEICFRDAYLSRSDMWRFASQELVGKTIHVGQKLLFINSLRATVRNIHVHDRRTPIAYFGRTTVPVFRSEAARYVIFIQMSKEMWDFDSEGNGEILFNKVVNGFLPELFKRWSNMEVRHLVSIVMFGRLEYRQADFAQALPAGLTGQSSAFSTPVDDHQDFYRVVVTDMASAQWTTILDELKRDFQVFLRDISLFEGPQSGIHNEKPKSRAERTSKITGRVSGALKGNVLEAINLAASQFSNDYIDRDLIRTGISTVVITAGSGVFDVDRDLLRLTSENLTNNGIGIDVVCLSKMPLHSVPLFRYRLKDDATSNSGDNLRHMISSSSLNTTLPHPSLPDLSASPAFSSTNASMNYFSRFPAAFPARLPQTYGYGIPQWIDLSYWSSEMGYERQTYRHKDSKTKSEDFTLGEPFVPRVRMYELQMMGLMEMGMADIAIPYLSERSGELDVTSSTWKSTVSNSQYSRSFSQSPELKRRSPVASMRMQRGMKAQQALTPSKTHAVALMDEHDNTVFTTVPLNSHHHKINKRGRKRDEERRKYAERDIRPGVTVPPSHPTPDRWATIDTDSRSDTESVGSNATKPIRPARAPRNFSYSAKGLMPFQTKAKAVTAEVQVENVRAQKLSAVHLDGSSDEGRPPPASRSRTMTKASKLESALRGSDDSFTRPSTASTAMKSDEGSRPIKIHQTNSENQHTDSLTKHLWQQRRHQRHHEESTDHINKHGSLSDSDDKHSETSHAALSVPSSVPDSKIPFVRNVNASNPLKKGSQAGTFGRWQHLYPRKPRAARMKWRSLCTPASVPLTTEEFPSREELENNYDLVRHHVKLRTPTELQEDPQSDPYSVFLEMVSLRIAHGYQFVVGRAVSEVVQADLVDCYALCEPSASRQSEIVVVLAMGNTIQKLELCKPSEVKVTKYVQKLDNAGSKSRSTLSYGPYVRTILANDYFPRQLLLQGFSERYPWEAADNHLAGEGDVGGKAVEELRYWRARFVLLPVEPPTNAWKKQQAEESEEEIHLLGIRALTQLWQKNRYISPDEKVKLQSRMGTSKNRDENPLEVKMETLNPSELIALELDRLTQVEEGGQTESIQLLPEPQKFDRESSMSKIAQSMQSESGIEIKNRRWHLRLYYNCFHGEEFTNWLMHNVKNMNTRKDAVEFGNQLMNEGLFEHVNGRHHFKDGHYFYSIKQQYRAPRGEVQKSWFLPSRSDKSVPPTPMVEQPSRELSPMNIRTRSGSNIAQQLHSPLNLSEKQPFNEKKRKAVSLSRMIRVNVDIRNKSFLGRPEIVNVHYDRFHNPENCYHLELNWLSTTCKLVDDAIISWTNTADRYGLKLVEVPIAEAFDIPIAEPFRNPYRIKLALEPPKQKLINPIFNSVYYSSNSFAPQQTASTSPADKHVYQKAILKRSNFVLDLEAASEFPEGVDIHYSWGQLNYRYTQYIHRSGVILAQIMDDGDIILIANRLYNSRLVNTKEASSRMFDHKKDSGPHTYRPAVPPTATASMQASGIVGINLASPSTGSISSPSVNAIPNIAAISSPISRPSSGTATSANNSSADGGKAIIADSFGPRSHFAATDIWNTLITPEQIKDDLEAFCTDKVRLEAFYKEVASAQTQLPPAGSGPGSVSRKATGSSSSSLLRPTSDIPSTMASDITSMPAFELPEALTAVRQLRRATVAYDAGTDLLDRSKNGSRNSSIAPEKDKDATENNGPSRGLMSPLRGDSKRD